MLFLLQFRLHLKLSTDSAIRASGDSDFDLVVTVVNCLITMIGLDKLYNKIPKGATDVTRPRYTASDVMLTGVPNSLYTDTELK